MTKPNFTPIFQEALDRCEALYKVAKDETVMYSLIKEIANLKMQIEQQPKPEAPKSVLS